MHINSVAFLVQFAGLIVPVECNITLKLNFSCCIFSLSPFNQTLKNLNHLFLIFKITETSTS